MDGTINTAENGSLSSEDRDNTSSIEREGTDINRNGSPERHQISKSPLKSSEVVSEIHSEEEEDSVLNVVSGNNLHTDRQTLPQSTGSKSETLAEDTGEEETETIENNGLNIVEDSKDAVEDGRLQRREELVKERDKLLEQLAMEGQKGEAFQEIAKELEVKCFSQQEQLESLQDQLDSERDEAGRRTAELEKELGIQIDKVTAMYKESEREKESVIAKLGVLEEERKKLIEEVTTSELKIKETTRENEQLTGLTKKQKLETTRLRSDLEKSESQCSKQTQEISKLKEEVSSVQIKMKWAQNKLKTETEAHKETKSQLAMTAKKLKEAREEGEQIRADLKTMIQQYQESEEMRSNSLDIKLKKTEKELKQHEQEIADQLELHELTVKELELTKASHKISQEEIKQHKQKLSAMTSQLAEKVSEIEELKAVVEGRKQDQKKLAAGMTEIEQLNQTIESERAKFAQLRETFTQLQKSHQQFEKELTKRKERETEMLALTEKLSSSNAELQAERSEWETKVAEMRGKVEQMSASLSESQQTRQQIETELTQLQESSRSEITQLYDRLESKTKAVEQLSMALEDEREEIKAIRKKNSNNIRDLQRQLQQSKRRIDQLEMSIAAEKEPPATLPITEGSRASSHSSLDGIVTPSAAAVVTAHHSNSTAHPTSTTTGLGTGMGTGMGAGAVASHVMTGSTLTQNNSTPLVPVVQHQTLLSDDERLAASPSPELFQSMDQEKILLVEKMCRLKKELAKMDEKMAFYEEHATQLTEDIQKKSKIIQSFIMREQSGVLAPPKFDEHKLKLARKGGIMATVFTGKPSRGHSSEMTHELSLEMNRKMQSVLEDTLLKNITLKENIDTLGKEIQRLSAQLQRFENSTKR